MRLIGRKLSLGGIFRYLRIEIGKFDLSLRNGTLFQESRKRFSMTIFVAKNGIAHTSFHIASVEF